jgi:hypothetical protein
MRKFLLFATLFAVLTLTSVADDANCAADSGSAADSSRDHALLQKSVRMAASTMEMDASHGTCNSYSDVGRGPFGVGNFRPVPRVKAATLTPELFHQTYVVPNRPVLISGAAENLFHDVDSFWNIKRLHTSEFAGEKQPVRQRHVRLAGCCVDNLLNVSEIYASPTRTVHFEHVTFEELLRDPPKERRLGLKQEYFHKIKNKTFLRNFGPAEGPMSNLCQDLEKESDGSFNLHLSNQGGAVPHSHAATLNVCVQGAKRWIMVDPLDYQNDTVRAIFERHDKVRAEASQEVNFSYTSQDWFMN